MADDRMTREDIHEAIRELEDGQQELTYSELDRIIVLLAELDMWEAARIRAMERYRLLHDLPGYDKEALAEQYARAKRMVRRIEGEIVESLRRVGADEAEALLSGRVYVLRTPDTQVLVSVRPELASRLRREIRG